MMTDLILVLSIKKIFRNVVLLHCTYEVTLMNNKIRRKALNPLSHLTTYRNNETPTSKMFLVMPGRP